MDKQIITTFEEAVAYLYQVPLFTSKHTLQETKAFLGGLGSPDRKMKIIHVAGTNGKGSVCAYLRHILEEAGYSACVFTSPHLVDIRERFLIKGSMVGKDEFLRAFLHIYDSLDWQELKEDRGYHPTFFEYMFLMAMLLFGQADADYCILETGLGGRLDATNAVSRKELAVITRIALDHVQYLGDSIAQIAGEKAGIMQENVPLVYADDEEEASQVFRRRGAKLGVSLYPVSKKDYTFLFFQNKNIDFSLHTRYYGYIRLRLSTIARYQMENASLAVRAVETLDGGRTVSEEALRRGVEKCFWQGRMEELLPGVYVDGAHNEDGIQAFLDTVREDGAAGRRKLLFGAVSDKDCGSMIAKVARSGLFGEIAAARIKNRRGAPLECLEKWFAENPSCNYKLYADVSTAFCELLDRRMSDERIYIAGSLYLAGEIKEFLEHD